MARMRQQLRAMNCAGDTGATDQIPRKYNKVRFGVPLKEAFKKGILPQPLIDSMVYIAKDGVTTNDLFRRPGNPKGVKQMMKNMAEGRQFPLDDFNFYTHASVIKKFLLRIPKGIFGEEGELSLLSALEMKNSSDQQNTFSKVIFSLEKPTQRLLALLFGTWFRMIHHAEYSQMSSEAVAKSVTGSIFHTCSDCPEKVSHAVKVMKLLIENFACTGVFGKDNIQYYVDTTRSSIKIKEKFKYQYKIPSQDLVTPVSQDRFYGQKIGMVPNITYKGRAHKQTTSTTNQKALKSDNQSQEMLKSGQVQGCLLNVTSASVPDVNADIKYQVNLAGTKQMYATKSLSRFEYVKKKQIDRMQKRSDWFLSLSQGSIYENTSESGDRSTSREASVGRSTISEADSCITDTDSVFDIEMGDRYKRGYDTPMSLPTPIITTQGRGLPFLVDILHEGDVTVNDNTIHDETPFTENGVDCDPSVDGGDVDHNVEERYFITERWYKPL